MFLLPFIFAVPAFALVIYPEAAVFSELGSADHEPCLTQPDNSVEFTRDFRSAKKDSDDTPLPVLLWHGLGDSADAEGIKQVADLISDIHPGTYVHIISATEDVSGDRQASWFGNVSVQLEYVCSAIAADPILSSAPAVDALGFSQGGQFLRGYVERCGDGKNAPKVRSLVTFGSQHNGIAEFQKCSGPTDFVCHAANAILKNKGTLWSPYVQSHLVPAQYYRDPEDLESFTESSNFLADINNERKEKNKGYKENMALLEKFVMILFKDDVAVIPRETGWFDEVKTIKNDTSGEDERVIIPLKDRKIYKEDWIGLKELDKKKALVFEEVAGGHMQLDDKYLKRIFKEYFGPAGKFDDDSQKERFEL